MIEISALHAFMEWKEVKMTLFSEYSDERRFTRHTPLGSATHGTGFVALFLVGAGLSALWYAMFALLTFVAASHGLPWDGVAFALDTAGVVALGFGVAGLLTREEYGLRAILVYLVLRCLQFLYSFVAYASLGTASRLFLFVSAGFAVAWMVYFYRRQGLFDDDGL